MKTRITLLCCLLFNCSILKSQIPTDQDCLGAILLCAPIYTTTDAAYGEGNFPYETGPGTCQIQGEINSLWLKFSVISSGNLAFTIYPVSNMDYDWALYNLTNDSCEDVETNGALLSSCNSSQYAVTGIKSTGVGNFNGPGLTNAFNYLLPVYSNEFYYLQINNVNAASGGFTIDFTASTAVLFNCNSVSFAADQTSVCQKFCTDFFDSSANNPTSWQWIFEGASPATSALQNPTNICYSTPGNYDVTLITTNANGSDTLTLTNYITVYATPPFPTITQNGYTLTSSPASSYQWQLNAIDISGSTNQFYDVMQTGLYTVIVHDSNGCVNSASQYVLISGVNEIANDFNILIYPNPSNGTFVVEMLNGEMVGWTSIKVENTLGQIIFSSTENIFKNNWSKSINLSALPQGIYYLKIATAEKTFSSKIIINH